MLKYFFFDCELRIARFKIESLKGKTNYTLEIHNLILIKTNETVMRYSMNFIFNFHSAKCSSENICFTPNTTIILKMNRILCGIGILEMFTICNYFSGFSVKVLVHVC